MTSLGSMHGVYLCWSMPGNGVDSVPAGDKLLQREFGFQMNAGKELNKNGDHPCVHQNPPKAKKKKNTYYLISISINMTMC